MVFPGTLCQTPFVAVQLSVCGKNKTNIYDLHAYGIYALWDIPQHTKLKSTYAPQS